MMHKHNRLFFFVGLLIIIVALVYGLHYFFKSDGRNGMTDASNDLQLISPAFREGATISDQYTCRGQNVSPPLNILGAPPGTKSLALVMHDPDAVGQDFLHWLMWDIPSGTENIAANSVPVGAIQGPNGMGSNSYTGPCPPDGTGTHHYKFDLYALDTTLGLDSKSDRKQLESALKGHILDQTVLTGLYSAAH
jgi:Raf kinase inhibitor-like YbhB/YbcL family protein